VAALVAVFREVRRVLRDDGTVWLNLGDSYASSGIPGQQAPTSRLGVGTDGSVRTSGGIPGHNPKMATQTFGRAPTPLGCKPKDLLGIPWLVAFALRADGWYLRSEIIWHKPNPMPESVTDRPTKAHEQVFLLSKSARYFYDADAIREAHTTADDPRNRADYEPSRGRVMPMPNGEGVQRIGTNGASTCPEGGRNKRSVWTVATHPYAGAHFATFPPKLIEPCILAGCPERACGTCGAPWVRVVETTSADNATNERVTHNGVPGLTPGSSHDRVRALDGKNYQHVRHATDRFVPSCTHDADSAQGVVLDPFTGAGTTIMQVLRFNRSAIGVELSPEYAALARNRVLDDCPLHNSFAEHIA
jgi:DNA modification methylase